MFSSNKTAKNIIMLIIIAIFSKVSGFIRELFMASYYGASIETDAFFVAQTLPYIFFSILGISLGLIFIPMFIEIATKKSEQVADEFAGKVITITFILSIILTILGYILAPFIVKVIAPGFRDYAFSLSLYLIRILFPMILFISLSSIITGILQARDQFLIPSMVNIPFNIITILGIIFLSPYYGVASIAWATLFGSIVQLLIQLPLLKRKFHFQWKLSLRDKDLQVFYILLFPVIIGTAVQQLNIVVDRILASGLKEGSISAIAYADRLIGLGLGVIAMSIAVVIYPQLSRASAEKDYEYLRDIISRTIIIIIMILSPFTLGAIILRKELVFVVFNRGAFDENALNLTSYALAFYVLGAIPFSIREIMVRYFFSLKESKIPMINGLIGAGINIILNLILIGPLGIGGLGLATSLTGFISLWMLQYKMRGRIGSIVQREFIMDIAKIIVAAIIMTIVVFAHKNPLPTFSAFTNLFINIILGFGIYLLCIILFKVKEFSKVIEALKRQFISKNIGKRGCK